MKDANDNFLLTDFFRASLREFNDVQVQHGRNPLAWMQLTLREQRVVIKRSQELKADAKLQPRSAA